MRKKILFSKRQSSYGKLEGINRKKKLQLSGARGLRDLFALKVPLQRNQKALFLIWKFLQYNPRKGQFLAADSARLPSHCWSESDQ